MALLTFLISPPPFCSADSEEAEDSIGKKPVAKHLTLDEIMVTDSAIADSGNAEIGIKHIEKGRNVSIPDVIKFEPDIDLKRRTLAGDTTDSLSIRGLSGNRIMLNVDDRAVNAAGVVGGYYIDWSTVPLDNIEKLEIIKGGSSVRYGNNALGGIVNVVTKKPSEEPVSTFFGTYGSGNGIDSVNNFRLTHTHKVGPVGYSVVGSMQNAEPFLWNNDFEGKNFATTLHIDMPREGLATIGFQYTNSQRGFIRQNRKSADPHNPDFFTRLDNDFPLAFGETFSPYSGTAYVPGPGAQWDKTKYYLDLGYSQPVADGFIDFKFYKNVENRKEKNYSSSLINSSYEDGELVLDREVASDRSYGSRLEFTRPIDDHEFLVGIEHKVLAYGDTKTNFVDLTYNNAPWIPSAAALSFEPSSESECWGYYLQDTWNVSKRWLLTGGLRYDQYENKPINGSTVPELKDNALTPKITGTCRLSDSDTLTTSLYQALRTPGLPETYWWASGETGGVPVLQPEKNNAIEVTYQHTWSKTKSLRFSAYHYDIDDYIMFRVDPTWRGTYNIDKATIYGASIDGRSRLSDTLSWNGSITWQKSRKKGDLYDSAGLLDDIDYLPDWKISAGFEFRLPKRRVINLNGRWVSDRKAIYAWKAGFPSSQDFELVNLGSYLTVDLNLKVPMASGAEFNWYVENLFDRTYEERFGFPIPGRIIGAAVKMTF